MDTKNPIEFIKEKTNEGTNVSLNIFGKSHYIHWIDLMNKQVFNKDGYELTLIKIEKE